MHSKNLLMEKKDKQYAVFFDLDHTILSVSSGSKMFKFLIEKNKLNVYERSWVRLSVVMWFLRLIPVSTCIRLVAVVCRGKSLNRNEEEVFFRDYILPSIRKSAVDEIEEHRKKGAALVILSASVDLICRYVAEYLNIDGVLCTVFERNGDMFTGRVSGKYCYGREKYIRGEKWCRENGFSLEKSWYYGDGFSDRFIMKAAGHPVCINPGKLLSSLAEKLHWDCKFWE